MVGPETLARTTLGRLGPGARVNLERPLRLGDRLGGHLVAGHVDGVGQIAAVAPRAEAVDVTIRVPAELLRYVIAQGLDRRRRHQPDGQRASTPRPSRSRSSRTRSRRRRWPTRGRAALVNLEVDLIGKYVEKLVGGYRT